MTVSQPVAIDGELFRRSCAQFATGVAVAAVFGIDGLPYGLTVNSFTSVSCSPPLVLVCIDRRCSHLRSFRTASHYGLSILSSEQQEISVRFSCRDGNPFSGTDWYCGKTGVPLIGNSSATLECQNSEMIEAGDHFIFIGEVKSATVERKEPLLYYGSEYRKVEQEIG